MKKLNFLFVLGLSILMVSCVSTKKYKALNTKYSTLNSDYQNSLASLKDCQTLTSEMKTINGELTSKSKILTEQVDYLKNSSSQILGTLQDMSVLTNTQAESMKQSLKTLTERDAYIKNLNSAIQRKDSLNLILVTNLKSSLANVNDKDINITVEKGVVYIDISDKMLFNTAQYTVTEGAKTVLGKIANILNAHPDLDVMVEGNTDSIPIHNNICYDNWDLSVLRATSVVRLLQDQYKIDPMRITAAGNGKYLPIASNITVDGRALNRRTRIILLPQLDQFLKLYLKKP